MITSYSVNTGGLGRFGNQCFTIASTIGIAVKNGHSYVFPEWINRDNALFGGAEDKIQDYFVNELPRVKDGMLFQDIPYHWDYREYNLGAGNWNICSHLQDERYFKHCMPLIREAFRMKDEPEQNEYVAIHYRAGDYIDDPNAYHPRCANTYYLQALSGHIPKEAHCLVFSDDLTEAANKLQSALQYMGRSYEFVYGTYMDDFKRMKRCKHFITANSSFSLFAAILGEHPDKKIICPQRWFGTAANGLKFEGYPEGAIIL